jgi:hypothetical protein
LQRLHLLRDICCLYGNEDYDCAHLTCDTVPSCACYIGYRDINLVIIHSTILYCSAENHNLNLQDNRHMYSLTGSATVRGT